MPAPSPPEIERRALALFEHLADAPDNTKLRARLLKNEPEAVLARLQALEDSVTRARGAIPTLIPGSADCGNALPPPERVGAFRLTTRIGRGGMGDVWLGQRDDGLYEQKVAIKLIQRHALARAAAAFEDERRFLARLEHPNIARLIDGGVTEDGLPWLAMEFFDGQPIDSACETLSDAARVQLFVKAADAVQYAHSRMVAHADLKPSNILVDAEGRVKLLDFGIAGLIGDGSRSPTGSGPLTRDFASPQRLAGDGPSVADDVFALGKTLSLSVGIVPSGIVPSRRFWGQSLKGQSSDAELIAIATKAQEPEEAHRYGSVAALIADLDRWRAQLPVSAMPEGWNYRAGKFVDRHRAGVLATGAAMILLSGTSLVATTSYVRAERERGEASARFDDARSTARFVSVDLLNQLAARPGTLKLRSDTAQVAQVYLDRLVRSPSAPPGVRLEAAEGLLRLAEAQGKPGYPNLGQPEAAKRNLARGLILAQSGAGRPAQRLAVRILLDQARLSSYVDNDVKASFAALAAAKTVLDSDTGSSALLRAHYFNELSATHQWQGTYPDAIAAARSSLAVLPKDESRDAILLHASSLDLMAEAIYYAGQPKLAVAPYREALAALEHAASRFPEDQIVARRLGRGQWALASTLLDIGAAREALPLIQASAATARRIAALEPADDDAKRMLGISENVLGQALAANGRRDEGIRLFLINVSARRALADANPDVAMRARDYMIAVKSLGDLQTDFGRVAQGCQTYEEARHLISAIKARGRLTGLDLSDIVTDLGKRERAFCAGTGQLKKS